MKIYNNIKQWTEEWLKLRKWVITWTKLKNIWWPKAQITEIYKLLAEEYCDDLDLRAWEIIERWNELEPTARLIYENITKQKVEEVWFIKKEKWLWLSPDWIIKIKWKIKKAIEIKCPMWANYIKYLIENKIPDEYYEQVLNYFLIIDELEELDFIIYNPDVKDKIPSFHIINIERGQLIKELTKMKEKIQLFKKEWDFNKNILLNKIKNVKHKRR